MARRAVSLSSTRAGGHERPLNSVEEVAGGELEGIEGRLVG